VFLYVSLPEQPILLWEQLDWKFHEHFCNGSNKLKLSRLTLVTEGCDELVIDYIKRLRETKN
jgi:hypothetical protein